MSPKPFSISFARCSVADPPTFSALRPELGHVKRVGEQSVVQSLATSVLLARVGSGPSEEVSSPRHWFKMIRINAVPNPAKMIQVNLARQGAMRPDVEGPVGKKSPLVSSAHMPISIAVNRARPKPASVVRHFVSDPVIDQWAARCAMSSLTLIMLLTERSLEPSRNTVRIVNAAHRIHVDTLHQRWR